MIDPHYQPEEITNFRDALLGTLFENSLNPNIIATAQQYCELDSTAYGYTKPEIKFALMYN